MRLSGRSGEAAMLDKILLSGMKFRGFHGALKEEQVLGQPFIIDLELRGQFKPAGEGDNLGLAVNYAEVYSTVRTIVEERRYNLIEALAEAIAATLLADFGLEEVLVRVNKPQAPIPGIFDNVAVEIVRERDNVD